MATLENTTVAAGVRRTDCPWGYLIEGSREALLSAGLAQASWLQDGTKRNKRGHTVRSKELTVNGRHIKTIVSNSKRKMVTMWMDFTEAELAARGNVEAEAEAAEARRQIDAMPKSAEAYRKKMIDLFERFVGAVIDRSGDSSSDGYRLHPETISELQRVAGHMVNAIDIGEIVFDRKARYAAEIKIRVKAAKADPAVQSFMQRITGDQGASE